MIAHLGSIGAIAASESGVACRTRAPGRRPNHRVEVNRHQPPCLPGRFDFMIVALHSNLFGQVAVTHPGRWAIRFK